MNKKEKSDLLHNFLEKYKNCTHDTQEEWEYDEDEKMYCINHRCKKCHVIIECVYTERIPSENDIVTDYPTEKQLKCKVCERDIDCGTYCSDCMKNIALLESDRCVENETIEDVWKDVIDSPTFIYKCGVDSFTNNYESSFDAAYDNKKCIILQESCCQSFVKFEDGNTSVVDNMYLMKL